MLWERMLTDCVIRTVTDTPDGEGGQTASYADGTAFTAAVIKNTDAVTRVAERDTDKRAYTVTSEKKLDFHDVFKRLSDGQVFRITSKAADSEPPASAGFSFYQVQAETWEEAT